MTKSRLLWPPSTGVKPIPLFNSALCSSFNDEIADCGASPTRLVECPRLVGERLAKEFPSLEIVVRNSYEGIEEDLRDAGVIFTLSLRPGNLLSPANCVGFTPRQPQFINYCSRNRSRVTW